MSDTEHDSERAAPPAEDEKNETITGQMNQVREAAQALADAVNNIPKLPPIMLPRLVWPDPQGPSAESEPVDPRRTVVTVRTIRSPGIPSETHRYSDYGGLTFESYGPERDLAAERTLEISNSAGDVVAIYPAGTWLHVCYDGYAQPDPATFEEGS